MEDWENDDFTPVAPALVKENIKSQWDDEDADEDAVKESWEDEDTPKESKPLPAPEKKSSKTGEKLKKADKKKTDSKVTAADSAVLDPVSEKLRQQRIEEEADYKSTMELFPKKSDDRTLDNFIPKSEKDFMEYAELISHKLRPYEKSFHYIGLLKAVMRLSMTAMKAADAKEVGSSVTALANEKIKAEKEANAGKKKGTKKKQLLVDKPDDDVVIGGYDALDDFDFM